MSKQFVFFSFSVMITWRAVSVKPVCFVLWRFTVQLVRRPWCHTWPSCLGQRFEFILVSWLLPLMDQDEMKWTFCVRGTKLKSESLTGFEPMTSQVPVSGSSWVQSLSGILIFCLPIAPHFIFIIYSPSWKFTICHYSVAIDLMADFSRVSRVIQKWLESNLVSEREREWMARDASSWEYIPLQVNRKFVKLHLRYTCRQVPLGKFFSSVIISLTVYSA